MLFRVASVVLEIFHLFSRRVASVVPEIFHALRLLRLSCRGVRHRRKIFLGHNIGRNGSSHDEERCQAVVDFPPLKEKKLHTQQFLGCADWLRGYLPAEYGHAAKVLG